MMNMVTIYSCQEDPMLSLQQTLTTTTHTENPYIGEIWDWGEAEDFKHLKIIS